MKRINQSGRSGCRSEPLAKGSIKMFEQVKKLLVEKMGIKAEITPESAGRPVLPSKI